MSVPVITCSRCGTRIKPGLAGGLCLSCLLSFGLKESHAPPDEAEAAGESSLRRANVPDTFDRFRVIEKIGEGGCGVVYHAEQLEPVRREVAIKVIKLGMDTRNVVARFEAERQALAMMDHAGIAKVFDAGATRQGRPFFAMELVRGEPITDYCDQKGMNVRKRLELFAAVCHAVQHAHQKSVIHRDLKPSNILVTAEGHPQPKIIDFGIAKATARQRLADQTVYTAFDQFIGTPAYMSPEQAGLTGEDVDTRSDIYSLGVLLYELLTGQPPFAPERLRAAVLDEVCRIIREEEPVKPSTRLAQTARSKVGNPKSAIPSQLHSPRPAIPSDLDWIALKALEKQPSGRYKSAADFAQDIQRQLNSEPVKARPPSAIYRLHKMIRRNKLLFGASTAVLLAFFTGFVFSTWRIVKTQPVHRNAKQPVRELAARSERVARLMKEMLPGIESDPTSPDSLQRLAEALLARERFVEAEDAAREAVSILTSRYQDSRTLGFVTFRLVEALNAQRKWVEAEVIARDNVALWRRQPNERQQLMHAVHWNSILCRNQGKWAEAEPLQREAVQLCDEVEATGGTLDGYSIALCSQLRCWLGHILVRQRKFAEAEPMLLAGYEGVRGKTDKRDILHEQESLKLLAELCDATGRPVEAAQWRQKLAELTSRAKQQE